MNKTIKKAVCFTAMMLCIHAAVPAIPAFAAYTDTSVYKIETTKEFNSENEAVKAVEQLKKDTGWKAEYQPSGKNGTTYVLMTGGIEGESRAKNLLEQHQKETALKASYGTIGQKEPLAKAVSKEFAGEAKAKEWALQFEKETGLKAAYTIAGKREAYVKVTTEGIEGEKQTKAILSRFEKETGLKASYAPYGTGKNTVKLYSGEIADGNKAKSLLLQFEKETALKGSIETIRKQQPRYKIVTGVIQGESNAKNLLRQFENKLKMKGKYEAAGKPGQLYHIKSGYFNDEKSAKNAASQMKKNTGVASAAEKVKGTRFWMISTKNVDSQNLKKIDVFFKKKTWRYTASKAGKKQTSFRIVSSAVSEQRKANDGILFFKNKNIQATAQHAGNTTEVRYRIASKETAEQGQINKGLNVFKKNGAAGKAAATGKKIHSHYQLTTASIYEQDKVKKALRFFEELGLHAATEKTGQYDSRYTLSSEAVLSTDKLKQALEFFSKRNIPGKIVKTGEYGYRQYRITASRITSKTDLDRGLNVFKKNGVSATYQTKTTSLFHILINEQFTGKIRAEAAANRIKTSYGWPVTIIKIKNGPQITTSDYGITLSQMVDKQMKVSPQTDAPAYVSLSYINTANQTVTADLLNVRSSPRVVSGNIIGQLQKGNKVSIISQENGWAKIRMNWRNASREEVEKYVNPENFTKDSSAYFQFLKLSQTAGLNAAEVNRKILYHKGILTGKGQAFIDAARRYSINELYLISHSLLETGNGTSELAKGTMFNGKKVYNMYGVGAYDSNPLYYGAKYAYEQGWFTPEAAIMGGAKFIGEKYIHHPTYKQDTLYKMRWSPNALHQYATDAGWAYKQVGRMYGLYVLLEDYTLYYDVSVYR
uniref:N-acetylglucosaminidase n=2 Tax=Bacillus sonorensis TaxID=119858 RepID=UPI0021183207|nr:N-acetylglucosaminidase [Bacillus sonorensis]